MPGPALNGDDPDREAGRQPQRTTTRPSRGRLAIAIAIPLIAVLVIAILAKKVESTAASDPNAPLAVPVVLQTGATSTGCTALDAALPATIDNHARRTLVVDEAGVAAWGDPAIVMRCGISDPDELTCSSALTVYNGVSWLPIAGDGSTTYIAVDRSSRVALTLDNSVNVGAVQAFSDTLKNVMPERAVCTDGIINPTDTP